VSNRLYSKGQLLSMEACTGCAACAEVCPAVKASGDGKLSGLYRLDWRRRVGKMGAGRTGWLRRLLGGRIPDEKDWKEFSETVYRCTLCGNCKEVCPAGIGLKDIWLGLRQELLEREAYPAKIDLIRKNLDQSHNVFGEDQEERVEWVEDLDDPPDDLFVKDRAEVVYFSGCVASYFPLAQQIPLALAEVLQAAEVDFTLLGEEEWCCGFPLLSAGDLPGAQTMIQHNLDAVRAKGAREVVFACPSCHMMWKEHYSIGSSGLKLSHTTQFLDRLLTQERLPLREKQITVTYHDPCDLGRAARVFEAPRRVIRALPGVELVEMPDNREQCLCCGGGGNLEMIDQKLNAEIARMKVDQVLATGAEAVVSGCQQCLRTMATHARRNKLPLKVMDVTQLVQACMVE
jgi:heterodisulfide reductase subunit D